MNRIMTKAALGLGALASVGMMAAPAQAQSYYHHRDNDAGVAVAAGIVGLAIGAAIASSNHDRRYDYDRRYYNDHGYYPQNGYYARDYAPRYNDYRYCTTRWTWDRYEQRRVLVRYCR